MTATTMEYSRVWGLLEEKKKKRQSSNNDEYTTSPPDQPRLQFQLLAGHRKDKGLAQGTGTPRHLHIQGLA